MTQIKPTDISNLPPGLKQWVEENREEEKPVMEKSKNISDKKEHGYFSKKFSNIANVRFSNKRLLKSGGRPTIRMPGNTISSILNERNIFFK